MFFVKPIKDIELQKDICKIVGDVYVPGTLAYCSAELSENETIDHYIGICQFIPGEDAKIVSLSPAPGCEEDEAIIILLRTVMSFLERAGSKTMILPFSAGPAEILKKCGLVKSENGYTVDLVEFYKAPCRYNKENQNG